MWVLGDHNELLLAEVDDLRTYLASLVAHIEEKSES
jgi:hypothetical protein